MFRIDKELQAEALEQTKLSQETKEALPSGENLFLEGDNLEALKLLQTSHSSKIKMIYIDPPYNTRDKSRSYKDSFAHDDWCMMMYPRLYLARSLLRDDGVIFISIDDNEVANLKLLCNEIFGGGNFVANVVWQKKYAPINNAKKFSIIHDHILVYQKSKSFKSSLLPRTTKQNATYRHDDNDGSGPWAASNLTAPRTSKLSMFSIVNPSTGEKFLPPKGRSWCGSRDTIDRWLSENRIYFGKDGKGAPRLKRYLNEVQQGIVPTTWWSWKDVGHNDAAKKEMKALFGSATLFDTPKPTKLIEKMLKITTSKDDIVLDFFAGSATTAHAVMKLNAEDGGNRKFIMVQLPEKTKEDSEAYKAGYKTIADISKERIRRAGKKIGCESNFKKITI